MKKLQWFKIGDEIPSSSTFMKSEIRSVYKRPPQGGEKRAIATEWFLYEVPIEKELTNLEKRLNGTGE